MGTGRVVEDLAYCGKRWDLEGYLYDHGHRWPERPCGQPMSCCDLFISLLPWLDDRAKPNGELDDVTPAQFERRARWTGKPGLLWSALVDTGWIDKTSTGHAWHDYWSLNGRTIQDRLDKRNQRDEQRKKQDKQPDAPPDKQPDSTPDARGGREGGALGWNGSGSGSGRLRQAGGSRGPDMAPDAPRADGAPPASLPEAENGAAKAASLELAAKLQRAIGEREDRECRIVTAELLMLGIPEEWLARRIAGYLGGRVGAYAWKRSAEAAWRDEKPAADTRDFGVRAPDTGGERQRRDVADYRATVARLQPLADLGTITPRDSRALKAAIEEIPRLESYLAALPKTAPAYRSRRAPMTTGPR